MENVALSLSDVLTVEAEHFLFILWAMCSVFGVLKEFLLSPDKF